MNLVFLSSQACAAAQALLMATAEVVLTRGFSSLCPSYTDQPINVKFCVIDYVPEATHAAKYGWGMVGRGVPTYR